MGVSQEIVLIERPGALKKCIAEVDDIRHGIPFKSVPRVYSGSYQDIRDSDLIIIAAGRNRKPGETRLELMADNVQIAAQIADELGKYYTKGIILIVTNPVDIITYALTKWLCLPVGTVFGTGCILDSSRLVSVIANHLGLAPDIIDAYVIGEHGDRSIVPWNEITVSRIPIMEYCNEKGISFPRESQVLIENKVRSMGMEIIKGKSRTHYGIATCVCYIADAIINNSSVTASVTSILQGEYGINDIALSLPSIISQNGIERRLVYKLDDNDVAKLNTVANELKVICQKI